MTAPSTLARITAELTDYFSATLRLSRDQIGTDMHILELGVDSIMLIEAQRWLKTRFDCVIEVQQFFEELNTIDRLAAYLATQKPTTSPASPMAQQPLTTIASSVGEKPHPPASARAQPITGNHVELMQSQLALLRDVIEAQNQLLMKFQQVRPVSDDA